jgi:aspartate/methionine/tyrosine aminotransferase
MVEARLVDKRERTMSSEYMPWAKTRSHARFSLATSGIRNYSLSRLPVKIEDLEINGTGPYGYEPLLRAISAKTGTPVESIVTAAGTSMANHLLMAALLNPGDQILIEHPTYELITATAGYFGADIVRFQRTAETAFRVDPAEVERNITPQTRLIVIANLHNPTGAFTDEETLKQIGEIARRVGAKVLVDEVYLDALFDETPRSAFHLGPEFVVTNSLTKVYGLSGLRCGWILAEPDLAQRIWRLNDLFAATPAHPAELLSCIALANLKAIADESRQLLERNGELLATFLQLRDDLECPPHRHGTTAFPRLKSGNVDDFLTLLKDKYETSVVPGRFFEMPQHFRIGIGGDTEMVSEGLKRLGMALDELKGRRA